MDFVQLEFFMYGLVGLVFTHNFWAPGGITLYLWTGIVWSAIHRFDFDEQRFEFQVISQISLWLGAAVGLAFFMIFKTPRLFNIDPTENTEVKNGRGAPIRTRYTPEGWLAFVSILFVTLGVYYVSEDFVRRTEGPVPPGPTMDICDPTIIEPMEPAGTGVSESTSIGVGTTLIIVFGILFILVVIYSLVQEDARTRARRLLIKYMFVVAVRMTTAAIYDFTTDVAFVGFNALILVISLLVLSVLEYFYIGYIAWWVEGHGFVYDKGRFLGKAAEKDPSPDFFQSRAQVLFFVVMFGTVHVVTMALGGGIDAIECNNTEAIVIAFGAISVFWILLFLVIRYFFMGGATFFDKPDISRESMGARNRPYSPVRKLRQKEKLLMRDDVLTIET